MITSETKIRVRYGETDKMGYCYYGVYPQYLEVGRTDLMRNFGLTYRQIEENGILLPVLSLNIKYIRPAFYDDELTVRTIIEKMPSIRIEFKYEIYNQDNELLSVAETTLVFVDDKTRKPLKAPASFLDKMRPFFKE
jgi:acyl-CoA thioester hydrolase